MARVVIPGCPHHVTQRGNRREDVFFTAGDRERYVEWLGEYAAAHGLEVQAYCLMTNHLHLVVVPKAEASLGAAMKPLGMRYAQHVNGVPGLGGRLWQGRFFSCPLDDERLWAAVRYVERNPVRTGMVDVAEAYRWSSAAAHCGLRQNAVLSDSCELLSRLGPQRWSQWLREPWEQEAVMMERLRACTYSGRPAGGEGFVSRLEAMVGRPLRPGRPGHPPKRRRQENEGNDSKIG
jgi:putative transposase